MFPAYTFSFLLLNPSPFSSHQAHLTHLDQQDPFISEESLQLERKNVSYAIFPGPLHSPKKGSLSYSIPSLHWRSWAQGGRPTAWRSHSTEDGT